jgi:hypothetical protein
MIEKKKIEPDRTQEVVNRLEGLSASAISVRQFIIMYFDQLYKLQQSGRSLRAMYEFIRANEIDVGTYDSFQAVYNRIKRARKINPIESASSKEIPEKIEPEKATKPEKSASTPLEAGKTKDIKAEKTPKRLPGLGLSPIFLADGTEIEIDPDTGARIFQIKSNKETQEQK